MKKKVLSLLLCGAMMMTMLAACGNDADTKENGNDQTQNASGESGAGSDAAQGGEETPAAEVTPEAIPAAFAHYTFDGDDEGYAAVAQVAKAEDSVNDGATYDIQAKDVALTYADGAVGQALYMDGTFGLDLNLEPTNTDVYSISYWVNAKFFFNYGATFQMGYNIGKAADAGNNVTWLNVTQWDAKTFPIFWSRNEASNAQDGTACWPWFSAWDDAVHGKKEWVMLTLVCSGEKQERDGVSTVGAQYYLNGNLMYDSADNYTNHTYWEEWTWDATLAPNIMQPGDNEFESWFGVNYWDPLYTGWVDDLYVFDSALNAGQVLTLYQMGNPDVAMEYPDAPESSDVPAEPAAADHSDVAITGVQVGATDCSTPFWTEFSQVVEVPNGESVTVNFKNYTSGLNNWNNFVVILQNVADAHSAEDNGDYKEYAVVRADNFGWGAGYENIAMAECDWNWDTFGADIDGADVELTITNNGDNAEIVAVVKTVGGAEYHQSYKGIAVDGDLYYCLTVDGSFIDIQ